MAIFSKGALRAYHLGLISCIIGFMAGYDSGVAGGILTFTSFSHDFRYNPKSSKEKRVNSLTVSLLVLGAFVSCLFASFISERLGRRFTIRLFSAIMIVGVILQTINTHSLPAWYVARVITGFGQGGCTIAVPVFVAEMAPKEIRGRMGSFYQWMFTWGIFTAYWINYGMSHDVSPKATKQWQIPVGLQLISGTALFLGTFTVTESVRWLLKTGKKEEAYKSLVWVRAGASDAVNAEFVAMQHGLEEERELKRGFRRTEVIVGENRNRVATGSILFIFQQLTGANALAYFSPQFFSLIVGSGPRDILFTALFGAVKVAACTLFILFAARRFGRRKPLIFGGLMQAACMLPLAIILKEIPTPKAVKGNEPLTPARKATVALLMLNIVFYNFSWGPLPWAYVPEIFPNRTREMGTSVCVSMHWLFSFVFTISTPYMISTLGGWGTFLFFAVWDVVMATWVYFFMTETQGKSLEAVQAELDKRDDHPDTSGSEESVNETTITPTKK